MDRGEAGVAGSGTVVPHDLEMVKKVQDHWGVKISQGQLRRRFAAALLEVSEQQLESVPVAFDRPGAHAALVDETAHEEVLDELIEPDLGRSHGAPSGRAKVSKRSATTFMSSGTAERYQ